MATLPYWNNDEVISSDKLNSMVKAIIDGDPLAIKVSNATKNDVNQIVSYLSSLYNSAKTNLNSATSTSAFDTAYTDMKALVSNKLGSYANDDTVDLYSTGIRASIITFLQAYDTMMSNDRLNNKNTDNTLNGRIDSEAQTRANNDNEINTKISNIQANGGGRNILHGTRDFKLWGTSISKVAVTNGNETFQAITGVSSNSGSYDLVTFGNIPLEKDTDYTASFWVKTNKNTDIWSYLFDSGSNGNYSDGATVNHATTDYTRVVVHFHNGNNTATPNFIPVRIKETGVTVWVYGCMLERGTVAHDWQPAPDDTDNAINSVNAKADANTASISKITSNGGGINLFKDTNKMTNTNYWGLRGYQSSQAFYGSNNPASLAGIALSDNNVQLSDKVSFIDYIPQIIFEQGTDYTVSFWTTLVDVPKLFLNANDNTDHQHSNCQQTISLQANGRTYNGWKQVVATFQPTVATAYLTFAISSDSNNTVSQYWASSFKLEKGTVAHDWSPSPYDTQSQLDNLNANKLSSADANWNLVAKNSSSTYNYASGSKITLPNGSSITVYADRIVPHINLPKYLADYTSNTDFNVIATSCGECDNLFIPSAIMATLSNCPTNPDTNDSLTGDCFYTYHYAYSGTTVRAFQKIYSCDYNYVFIRSYNSSSQSWTNWSCLTPYA